MGWRHFAAPRARCANDRGGRPVNLQHLDAGDLACLAQASVVLGLHDAAEALAIAAYVRLEAAIPPQAEPAARAIWNVLASATFTQPG